MSLLLDQNAMQFQWILICRLNSKTRFRQRLATLWRTVTQRSLKADWQTFKERSLHQEHTEYERKVADQNEYGLQCFKLVRKVGGRREFTDVEKITQLLDDVSSKLHVISTYPHLQQALCHQYVSTPTTSSMSSVPSATVPSQWSAVASGTLFLIPSPLLHHSLSSGHASHHTCLNGHSPADSYWHLPPVLTPDSRTVV